jgi:hypothetical protein
MICEVCNTNESIGVACTSIPYSCAFCRDCALNRADPEWIFLYLLDEVGNGDPENICEGLTTYVDGKYIPFHQWAASERPQLLRLT